jgi:hypothetical protein
MKGTLDPTTLAKIEAFARRRRQLILMRGVCAVLAILLAGMMALAFVDWQVLLADEVRWALSAAVYGAALAAAWATALRLLWRSPDARVLARFIEQVRPDLREDLLSAVELGDPRGASAWDSEEFREILQRSVADRMRGVEVRALLSFRRIAPWAWSAAGMAGVCAALLLLPGLRYDHLLLRSLLPLANLERLSRVSVTILEPDPAERVVPQGDVVAVRVETAGPETRTVLLETFVPGRKAERVEMKPAGSRRFEAGIAVSREPVAYRIRAGDAITRKFTLTAVARPEAVAFHKTYTYPAYAGKAPRPVTEENGDLVELEGTTVELEVEVNQEVRSAELRLEQAGKSAVLPLRPAGAPRRVRAEVPITTSGTYRLHLVAQGTDFENKFSPQYEIRAVPDLVPRVTLDDPTQDQILPPDEIVTVRGTAKDDLGLKRVTQMVRVNQADWTESVLSENAGVQVAIVRRWDLYDLGVQPGDRVTTKLVAVDLKGNRAESAPLHVVISAPGFDPQRLVPLAAKEGVLAALEELRKAAQALEKRLGELARKAAGDDLERQQALLTALADAEKVAQEEEVVESRTKDALRVVRGAREAGDLVLVARLARRLREEALALGRAEVEKASRAPDAAAAKAALARASASFRQASEHASAAEAHFRDVLAGEEAIAILNDLKDLAREQAGIHRQAAASAAAKDPKVWERLSRRQGVAASQAKAVEDVLGVLVMRAPEGQARRASKLRQDLEAAREALRKKLEGAADASLDAPSQALRQQVDRALAEFLGLEAELARRAVQAREALEKRAETQTADVRDAGRRVQAAADARRRLADLQSKNAPAAQVDPLRQLAREEAERAVLRWKGARAQLETGAGVEEARRESDPFFVADSSLAARVLQAVLDAHQAAPDAERSRATLSAVEKAYRTLETGHALADLASGLRELAEAERWGGPAPAAVTRHPKDWLWMEGRVRTLEEDFKAAGLPVEAARELAKAWKGPAGEALRREMAERAAPGRRPGPAAPSLERLGGDAGRALAQIQPAMEAARRELLKLVPSLPERLQELARAAERLKEKTEALADKAPQAEPAQVRPEARQLLENQQGLDRQIEDVMAELRRDANTQDLFTEQGRERARDADDAVAMLRQSPPKAEDLLSQAAAAPQAKAQEQALDRAAEQQGKLAEALKTLAEHYKNVEAKKPEETRPELRKAEEALGIKEQLDKQYAQMAKLAELARENQPEALRDALENALSENPAMKRELAQLTQNALDRAEQALQDAARQERQAAQALQNAAQQARAPASAAEQAKKIAEEARRMARQDVPQLAKEAQQAKANAQQPLTQAAQNLEKGAAAVPQDLSKPAPAAQGLEKAAQELQQAAQDLQAAEKAAQQAGQQAQQNAQAESQKSQAAEQAAQKAQAKAEAAQQAARKESQEAQAAEQASQAARQQAQAAQEAARKNPADAAAQQAAQAAQQKAQTAQQTAQAESQQAQAAQKAAEQARGEAGQAQQAAQKEARQAQAAQAARQQSQAAQQNAGKAAQKAADLARQAQQLAQQLRQAEQVESRALAQAAQLQGPAGELAKDAQADLQRAARNAQAMGHPEQSQALEAVAKGVEGVTRNEVPAALKAAQGKSVPQAQQATQAAEKALQAQSQALAQARAATPPNPQGEPGEASEGALSEAAAQFLAQALNALNGQGKPPGGPPGQQPPGGPPGPAQQAVQSAAQAQAQSMMQGRTPGQGQAPGQQPGQQPFSQAPGTGKGAAVNAGRLPEGVLPQNVVLKPGDWGKLPPRLARDLMEAQRESVGGEYRNMIETYFRVIAERAREKK